MEVSFKDVRRKQFDEIADSIAKDSGYTVNVYYSGTSICGSLSINCCGNTKAFNKALIIATEVITRVKA